VNWVFRRRLLFVSTFSGIVVSALKRERERQKKKFTSFDLVDAKDLSKFSIPRNLSLFVHHSSKANHISIPSSHADGVGGAHNFAIQ